MSSPIYAKKFICERPRVWYLAVGANVTIDRSVPGISELGEIVKKRPMRGIIIDYRAATILKSPLEYNSLALSISMHVPTTTLIAYISGPRNHKNATLIVKLLTERNFAARTFQKWGEMMDWLGCPPSVADPIPRKSSNVVTI